MKQFDEIMKIEDGYNLFLRIVDDIIFATNFIEIAEVGYCDKLFNTVLDYLEGKLNENIFNELDKESVIRFYNEVETRNLLNVFISIIENISFHPQSSIKTSNRAISFLEKLETIYSNNNKRYRSFESVNGAFEDILEQDSWERMNSLFKVNSLVENRIGDLGSHYSHTQSFSNVVLYAMQRDSAFQWKKRNKNILGAVVDFIYDSNTTNEMIKQVLLDRIDSFCVSKKENEKETIQLDDRIDALFEAIVTDERFSQKELPFELLDYMIRISNKSDVILKCFTKINEEYKSRIHVNTILDKLYKKDIYIHDFKDIVIPDDLFIEIVKNCESIKILGDILSCVEYYNFPKECVNLIWKRREEFDNIIYNDALGGTTRGEIYYKMFGCKYATKEMLEESLSKLEINSWFHVTEMSKVVLNSCINYEILKLLQDRLKETAEILNKKDVISYFKDWMRIEILNENPIEYASQIKEATYGRNDYMDEVVSKIIVCCFYYYEQIDQESLKKFLLQFGDRSKIYIVAYARLLNLVPSKEKDSFVKK